MKERKYTMAQKMDHVLSDLKVLDLSRALAGPSCTRMLAEMGAEVIKVEPAPSGELSRRLSVQPSGRSLYYVQQNLGKKSVCVNCATRAAWRWSRNSFLKWMSWSKTSSQESWRKWGWDTIVSGDEERHRLVFDLRTRAKRAALKQARLRLYCPSLLGVTS